MPKSHATVLVLSAAVLVLVGVRGERIWGGTALAGDPPPAPNASGQVAELDQLQDSLSAVSRAFKLVAKVARPGVVHIRVTGSTRSAMSESERKQYISDKLREYIEAEGLGHTEAELSARRQAWRAADVEHAQRVEQYLRTYLDDQQLERLEPELLEELYAQRAELERFTPRTAAPPGSGSGMVFDPAGYVLTNNHVIDNRSEITVRLDDERELPAVLIGTDEKTDLAVLKIDAPNLQALRFGNSDELEVGDWVIAVGSPFGLLQTVTHGIVSAKGRTHVPGIDIDYQDFIQTDAAINPGNSGGPLLNLRGEIVGVNTAIATHGDGVNAGVAFTIPANRAKRIAEQLMKNGVVARGWLGVGMSDVDHHDAEILGLPSADGVLIDRILADSPAAQAGLAIEDVIVAVNGQNVTGLEQLRGVIADLHPLDEAHLRVIRYGQEYAITVRLGLQPDDLRRTRRAEDVDAQLIAGLHIWGRTLRPAMIDAYNWLGFEPEHRGVVIWRLDRNVWQASEFEEMEVITGCNGKPVRTVQELTRSLQGLQAGSKVRLEILDSVGDVRVQTIRVPGR